ncbi:MAG: YggT family protein [Pseudonocardiales bacterium]|nr:YggT family protein [Pseudonocardiales bacterium]
MVLGLAGLVLLLFELLLIGRVVVDLASNPAGPGPGYGEVLGPAHRVIYRLTEPVLAPVRRVVRPVRIGGVLLDLSVTLVFIAVVVVQQLISSV